MNCTLARLRSRAAVATLLLLAAGGCRWPFGLDHLDEAREDLRAARSRWEERGSSSYRYTVQPICFCGVRAMRVTVSGGEVASRVWADDGQPVPASLAAGLGTVEDLFAKIQDAIDRDAAELQATYSTLGVPRRVEIDYSRNVADEEFGWSMTEFEITLSAVGLQ
ncbi:MAG TPA: DUF6174 domain-containing protein [Longimicrobium sp.]